MPDIIFDFIIYAVLNNLLCVIKPNRLLDEYFVLFEIHGFYSENQVIRRMIRL